MKGAGINVYDCSFPKRSFFRNFVGFFKFLKHKSKCDVILVGFMGQLIVPIVKIFTRKKIIFDALISIYQTLALERKTIPKNTRKTPHMGIPITLGDFSSATTISFSSCSI